MRAIYLVPVCLCVSTVLPAQTKSAWKLVWSDEFNGAENTPPDPTIWNYDLGGGGWGNGEQEVYTNSVNNAFQDGQGILHIRAIRDSTGAYTSARIRTGQTAPSDTANVHFEYGKIEARIKLPFGPGIWPAFWMLGSDISTVNWPQCGEVDILENFGSGYTGETPSIMHGSLHGPNFTGAAIGTSYTLPRGMKFTDDYHIFSIEWSPDSINYFVDGTQYQTLSPASLPAGGQWVFNDQFFIIMNLAIGGAGTFLGEPSASTPFPQEMLVDYVRVYQSQTVSTGQPAIAPGAVLNAASNLGAIAPGSLATIYGTNLSDAVYGDLFGNGAFSTSTPSGVTVSVNGVNAPLIYVSPGQINFQIPWEIPNAPTAASVTVTQGGLSSFAEPVTLTPSAPSMFADYLNSVAFTQVFGGGPVTAGATCTLYGNGFGVKTSPQVDGDPASSGAATKSGCTLLIDGVPATVAYCGTAPGLVIDQLNFVYPSGVPVSTAPVTATLTTDGVTGTFLLPSPAQ